MINKRIYFDIFLFVSLFFLPWWFSVIVILIGFYLFERFFEGAIAGFSLDLIFGYIVLFGTSIPIFLIIFVLIYHLMPVARKMFFTQYV